jgi:hypothetical protein
MARFFGRIAFFAFTTSVFAGETLTALVTAAQDFSVATQEQLAAVQNDISATDSFNLSWCKQLKRRAVLACLL